MDIILSFADTLGALAGSLVGLSLLAAAAIFFIALPIMFRVVVETNKVHIVQSRSKTTSYGTKQASGNVYYKWPSWLPLVGVTRIVLPVNNFDLHLHSYKAYDKERVPFELDLTAFFRIADTNRAAERVSDFESLRKQLEFIVQGAARKILASHDIHQIMTDRATFGEQFTQEVKTELENWGVEPVKNMELMDIRDADGSKVITNIMAKKSSHIEMESRIEVAKNRQAAETAEIVARRAVDIATQEALQQVGARTAEKDMAVGIANEQAQQEIKGQAAITAERQMAVVRVETVKQAEIDKDSAIVAAEQAKEVAVLDAEGQLEATKRRAEGVRTEGEALAAAEQAKLMAPVTAQITLAKEIGENPAYQQYLMGLKAIEGQVSVGTAQAEALTHADVKVIANAGTPTVGVTSAMELFSPKGGLAMGSMLEALSNTPKGKEVLDGLAAIFGRGTPNGSGAPPAATDDAGKGPEQT